jgi:hypothetical protein
MREILQRKSDVWKTIAFGCKHCDKTFRTEKVCSKHEEQCLTINTKKKLKSGEHMLIQRITKGGQSFYRQGQDGKLYKTREEAESNSTSMKKKGADGKACWEGYRYAGTKDGKDKCVKVKGR